MALANNLPLWRPIQRSIMLYQSDDHQNYPQLMGSDSSPAGADRRLLSDKRFILRYQNQNQISEIQRR